MLSVAITTVRCGIGGVNRKVNAVTSSATAGAVHNHRVRRKFGDLFRLRTLGVILRERYRRDRLVLKRSTYQGRLDRSVRQVGTWTSGHSPE